MAVDAVRFPSFNDPNTIGVTYYTGWESGLTYFVGSPIEGFKDDAKRLIDALANDTPIWSWRPETGF